jgi:prolyl oligopeptidase
MPAEQPYPPAYRQDLVETRHGLGIADPYRWLEDPEDPDTVRWLAGQEVLYARHRSGWPVDEWRAELAALTAVDGMSSPVARPAGTFYARRRAADEHVTLLVERDGRERLLLDPHTVDSSGRTVLDTWRPSVEGDLLAYQLSAGGTEDSRLWVMEVATGRVVAGPIDRVRRSPVGWLPGGTHFYYVRRLAPELHPGEENYHRRVYLHRVGSDPADDVMIFGEGRGKTEFYALDVTADGRWLRISATTGTDPRTDIWLADLTASPWHAPALRPVQVGVDARTRVHIAAGTGSADPVWLHTTDAAPYGRVVSVTAGALDGPWRELIPERPGAVLTDLAVLTGPQLDRPVGLVAWTRHAVSEITVHDLTDGAELGKVPLPGAGRVAGLTARRDGGHEAWFPYTDHRTPLMILHFDARTGETTPWFVPEVGADHGGLHTDLVAYESRDGTTVRMFLVSPGGRPDRPRPAILTGYGGFGATMSPAYSPDIAAWVRAGGVYAIACLRGGGEEGAGWHEAGRRERKQNVFDDFDAAADYLVDAGWTDRDRLGIIGGSNGGLLVAAALTQHPEKYAAAVCQAALLDMVRYERSGLGPSWRSEYGSADDPDQLRILYGYSPYHRVRQGVAYPAVLLSAAEGDSRVDPMHARKMCAALQHTSNGERPVLFRYERGVGHGARAQSLEVDAKADCLAFLGHRLGLPPGGVR